MSTATKGLRRAGFGGLAALIVATGLATASPAFADLTGSGGDIRVQPTDSTVNALAQPAPFVFAGDTAAKAANTQILMKNTFKSGDRVLLSVLNSANTNCADPASSIGYVGTPTVTVSGPFATGSGMVPNTTVEPAPDVPVAGDTADTTPQFNVSTMSSSSCAPNSVNDVLVITFKNQNSGTATDEFKFTVAGIVYNIGASVPAGPLHNAAFGQNAIPGTTPQAYTNSADFGGNTYTGPFAVLQWTNNALVSPVKFGVGAPNQLVADGTAQTIGDVTIGELTPNAMPTGLYTVTFNNATVYTASTPAPTVSGAASGETTTLGRTASTVTLNIAAASASTASTYVIKGLLLTPTQPGPISATLTGPAGPFTTSITPDDQGSATTKSSVDASLTVTPITAVSLPNRIGGTDRYETAAKIALNNGCDNIAVLANGDNFPDALSANFLAGRLAQTSMGNENSGTVSILLTQAGQLPASTVAAMRNLGVRSVYVVGGTGVVSSAVEAQLRNTRAYYCGGDASYNNQNLEVVRVGGADRYATNRLAIQLATNIYPFSSSYQFQLTFGQPSKATAIIATGQNAADALAAGPMAYSRFPLVLTPTAALGADATQTLTNLGITQALIVGGTGAVSSTVEASLTAAGITSTRLAGASRYETATKIADFERAASPATPTATSGLGWTSTTVLLARGDVFADALAGGPLAGNYGSSLLLTTPTALSTETNTWLTSNATTLTYVTALGLTGAVSNAALNSAIAAVAG